MLRFTTPVTIVTGFLGSGKTTLINHILTENHRKRIAVIENEFGEVGIDAEFLIAGAAETIVQLANGCVCCTVRGDLAKALNDLAEIADRAQQPFDRIIIETSGVADPGPVIQTFLAETQLLTRYHLDGVITLVDGNHGHGQLVLRKEVRAQIGHADRLIVTKADLCEQRHLEELVSSLAHINPRAPVRVASLNGMSMEEMFGHLFETRAHTPDYIPPEELACIREQSAKCHGHSHGNDHDCLHSAEEALATHLDGVASCVFLAATPLDLDALNSFLDDVQVRHGSRLWRCKGIVNASAHRQRLVVQGVQGIVQISGGTIWRPHEQRSTTLVFIGEGLDTIWIRNRLKSCELSLPGAG